MTTFVFWGTQQAFACATFQTTPTSGPAGSLAFSVQGDFTDLLINAARLVQAVLGETVVSGNTTVANGTDLNAVTITFTVAGTYTITVTGCTGSAQLTITGASSPPAAGPPASTPSTPVPVAVAKPSITEITSQKPNARILSSVVATIEAVLKLLRKFKPNSPVKSACPTP